MLYINTEQEKINTDEVYFIRKCEFYTTKNNGA